MIALIAAAALALLAAWSLRVRPRPAQAHLDLGDAQRADYLYYSAAASYRQAAQADPRDPQPWLRLGDVYIELGRYVEAIQAYAAASERGGNTPAVHAGLARALQGHGDLDGATWHWQQVVAQRPDDAQAWLGLARVGMAQDRWSEARSALGGLLEQQPDHAQAHFILGQLLALDEADEARTHWLAAVRDPAYVAGVSDGLGILDGSDAAAYRAARLGRLSLAWDELHLARRAFARAVELDPTYAEAQAYLGHVLDRLGRDGSRELAGAAQSAPDSVIVLYLWGVHLRQVGDLAQAKAAFKTALARDPSNAALAVEMGLVALQDHDYVGAEMWMVKATEFEPDNPAWPKQLARLYLGHLIAVSENGLPSAQQAVRLAPDDAEAHDWLGWGYYLTGDLPAAWSELQRALALDPRRAAAHYHMAAVLEAMGRPDQARLETERAASLDPAGDIGRRARQRLGQE